uniref:Uncharacterized protein n=1 Tax=Opuntia streptacantha TaxID=393608 RepID=A0A7C8YG93_OPUST
MLPYALFLKICALLREQQTSRKRTFLASNVSLIISNQVPLKCKHPECPPISIVIGDHNIDQNLLNLCASVNLLNFTMCEMLGLKELELTKMVDHSTRLLRAIVKVMFIKVSELTFRTSTENQILVIFDRSFLTTSNALINCKDRKIKLTFTEYDNGIKCI